jgi:hypothetical protein
LLSLVAVPLLRSLFWPGVRYAGVADVPFDWFGATLFLVPVWLETLFAEFLLFSVRTLLVERCWPSKAEADF